MGFAIRLGATWVFAWMLGAAVPSVARAQAETLSLEIEPGAPQWLLPCLSQATLDARYRAAREPDAGTAPLAVHVRVVSQTAAREATLEIRAANAERSLGARALPVRAQDCSAVADAVALVLVLLSRHAASEPPPTAAAPPSPEPPPTAAAPADPPPAPPPPPPKPASAPPPAQPSTPTRVRAGPGTLLMFGMLPQPAFGLSREGELVLGVPSLRLRASLLFPQTLNVAEGSVRFSAYELTFDACVNTTVSETPRIGLRLCAGPRAGLVHAASQGFELENYQPIDPTLYLGLGPEANLGLTDWALIQLSAGAAVGLFRPRYVLRVQGSTEERDVAEPSLVRAELALCLLLIF